MLSILTATSISLANKTNVQASQPSSTTTINDIYRAPINDKVTTDFVDKSLVGTHTLPSPAQNALISPMGVRDEVYHHSTYTVNTYTRTGQAVGPRQKVVTYASLAKGETRVETDTTQLSGTVTVSGSYDINALNIIKTSLSGSISGTISHSWSKTTTLTGPPEGSIYNTRLYNHAVDFDQYSYILNKTDVYYIYNNGVYYGQTSYSGGTTTVNSIKSPIFVSYSTDVIYPN